MAKLTLGLEEKLTACLRRDWIKYLLLLSAAHSVRLIQKPCAEDWVHIDSYSLDTDQQDCTWKKHIQNQSFSNITQKTKKIKPMINCYVPKKIK